MGLSVGLTKKKNLKKKNHQKSRNRRPWYPRMTLKVNIYIFGLGKMHNIRYKMFLFFSMLLLCSFFRLKELFQVKNGLTTSFHRLFLFFVFVFFLKMRQIWVGRTTLNLHRTQTSLSRAQRKAPEEEADTKRRKIEDGQTRICSIAISHKIIAFLLSPKKGNKT